MVPPPFHPSRPGLVRPVRVDRSGITGPTRAQARGSHWRRTSWSYYVPAGTDDRNVDQRIVEAAHHANGDTAVTGWAALRWMGARWFDGWSGATRQRLPVQLTSIGGGVRPQPGVVVTGECIPPPYRIVVDDIQVVLPVVAVAFEMRHAVDLRTAVRVFDMAAYDDLVSLDELLEHLEQLYHWTGIPMAREAAAWVDENAWSPREVDVRLAWPLDLGLPPPLTNRPVFDLSGRHLGTPDLLDAEAGLVIEYDGELHLDAKRRADDLIRTDDLLRAGLECLQLVGADVTDRRRLVRRIVEARARAQLRSSGPRGWTADPPAWWNPTHGVDVRRALSEDQRRRLLRYRAA